MAETKNTNQGTPDAAQGTQFERSMKARHLIMLSLGGVIGTGLFFNTGFVIATAGAFGTILAYLLGALIVWLVMQSLGELSVAMPFTGSFHMYASKFIAPWAGFTVAWLYWLTWTVAMGTSIIGAAMCMQFWFPMIPVWAFSVFFIVLLLAMNIFTTRIFAEGEFFFSIVKVAVIQIFIVLGGLAVFGVLPLADGSAAPYLTNLTSNGLFPNGVLPIIITMIAVNFAYSGTELIGVAAGETENPEKVIPIAIRTTLVRLIVFFVGTVVILACLLPPELAGVTKSPFVAVFERIGIPYTADIMNFVILTAIVSAANSGLYASGRMVWALADEGVMPQSLKKQNKHGVPVNAVLFSMVGGLLALFTSIYAADTVFVVLTAVSGLAVVVVWMSICLAHYNFRHDWIARGHSLDELKYKAPFTPLLPILGFVLCLASCIGLAFDPDQAAALWIGVPFVVICSAVYPLVKKWTKK